MKRLFQFLFGTRPVIVDVAAFGPRMKWVEVEQALHSRRNDPLFRAMGQLLTCQREMCVQAVADKSNLPAGQTAYEAGAAGGMADMLALLQNLECGGKVDAQIKAYFSGVSAAES